MAAVIGDGDARRYPLRDIPSGHMTIHIAIERLGQSASLTIIAPSRAMLASLIIDNHERHLMRQKLADRLQEESERVRVLDNEKTDHLSRFLTFPDSDQTPDGVCCLCRASYAPQLELLR